MYRRASRLYLGTGVMARCFDFVRMPSPVCSHFCFEASVVSERLNKLSFKSCGINSKCQPHAETNCSSLPLRCGRTLL